MTHFEASSGRIDLLMRNEGRHIDEVPGPGVRLILQPVTPTHPDMATDHIDDGLLLAVMVGSGRRMRGDVCYPRPYPLRANGGPRYRRDSVHPGRLWRIRVEMVRVDYTHGVDPRCRSLFRVSSRVRAHWSCSFEGPRGRAGADAARRVEPFRKNQQARSISSGDEVRSWRPSDAT